MSHEPDYINDLKAAETNYNNEVTRIAERVRTDVVIPLCRKHRFEFFSGNGTFFFSELSPPGDDTSRNFHNVTDVEYHGRTYDLKDVFDLLNTELPGHNDHLGFWVRDVRRGHLERGGK